MPAPPRVPRHEHGFPLTAYNLPTGCASALSRVERLATRLLGVPVAQLWLRPDVAAAAADACAEPGREAIATAMASLARSALCRHVSASAVPLAIPGGASPASHATVRSDDPALAADMLARGWGAYLGVPMLGLDGTAIGVLAVADLAPRSWTPDDVTALGDLATLAVDGYAVAGVHGLHWLSEMAHREAQVARRKNEERLSLVFNSTSDLTFLLAVEGERCYRCVVVNESYLAITGMSERAVVGRRLEEFMAPAAAERTLDRYAAVIAGGVPVRYEEHVQSPSGVIIVETTLTPIAGDDGTCGYLLGVAHDVTGRRDAERRLHEQKEVAEAARTAAEQASQAKTEFLSRMSHELRTPLNSVIGFANVLLANRGKRLDERDLSYLERIVTNGQHLLTIISDLLDISRIEAGKMPVTIAPVPLGPLVRTTAAGFEAQLAGRPVSLSLELPARVERLETDATKLQQVLINLIGNAIKFTDGGEITVRVVTDADTARPLRVEVEDTGIGIPAHRQAAIFAAFEQAETGTTRAYGGTGLGLAISRSLCQLLGFDLSVRSTPGVGATFIVDFEPAAAAAGAGSSVSAAPRDEADDAAAMISDAGACQRPRRSPGRWERPERPERLERARPAGARRVIFRCGREAVGHASRCPPAPDSATGVATSDGRPNAMVPCHSFHSIRCRRPRACGSSAACVSSTTMVPPGCSPRRIVSSSSGTHTVIRSTADATGVKVAS